MQVAHRDHSPLMVEPRRIANDRLAPQQDEGPLWWKVAIRNGEAGVCASLSPSAGACNPYPL